MPTRGVVSATGDVATIPRAVERDLGHRRVRDARAPREIRASPVTPRIRPPLVTSWSSRTAVPAWKTSAPSSRALSTPSIGEPVSPVAG